MNTGKAFVSSDVVNDFHMDVHETTELIKAQSLAACPVIRRNEVIGLLGDKAPLEKSFDDAGIDKVKYVDVSE